MTERDDNATGRTQVNLRLERTMLDELDAAAHEEGLDRAELARQMLADSLRRYRIERALGQYAAGRRTAWSAAELAGVSLYEMLDRIHEAAIPYRLDPDVIDRLAASEDPDPPTGPSRALSVPSADPLRRTRGAIGEELINGLRARYRPNDVRLLLVGESSPAGGTHFYLANSNLYRATREALRRASGVGDAPDGERFLEWFQSLGFWLIDLADRPVDDLPGRERQAVVKAGVPRLADVIKETRPERLAAVKMDLDQHLRSAAKAAGFDERRLDVLPFPVRQWRNAYVEQLTEIVRGLLGRAQVASSVAEAAAPYGIEFLQDAIAAVIRSSREPWLSARSIAGAIAERDLWRRPSDGVHPAPSQVRYRVRKYPQLFQVSERGIRLRDG